METTLGSLLVNEALPEDLRDYNRVWDKKSTHATLREVALKYPEQYANIVQKLMRVGQSAATSGDFSFSLKDFSPTKYKRNQTAKLKMLVKRIEDDQLLDSKQKSDKVVGLLMDNLDPMIKNVLQESNDAGNRLASVVASGSKGSPLQFNSTVGTPLLFMDHKDRPIPIPIYNSISQGFDPVEYWASAYGSRKGTIGTKFATADAGYFGKRVAQSAQRTVITEDDCETENGIPVAGNDPENIGTILQYDAGGVEAGTIIRNEHLKSLGSKDVIVRSPVTCQASGGICSRCAGIRETGGFPEIGSNIGISAASSLSERLSQGMLNTKHTAGAATGKAKEYSFQDADNLFEMPKSSSSAAPVAELDGKIEKITPSPTGGVYVTIGGEEHWAPNMDSLNVKVGDRVEAGDVLAAGIPNPSIIARHRGIGDARRTFVNSLLEVTGNKVSRRNAEVISRGMVGHVRVTDPQGTAGALLGDLTKYDNLVRDYEPREDSADSPLSAAKGQYLERPILHHTIGTRVNNRMVKDLKTQGINSILVNKEPPGFEPDVRRAMQHAAVDPDWMTRLGGFNVKSTLLKSVHEGATSDEHSTSFMPALAKGVDFGKDSILSGKY